MSKKPPPKKLTPREQRLLIGLLDGELTREQSDQIAKASNSPHYIGRLRRLGIPIECKRPKSIDADGKTVRPGVYCLQPEGRELALKLLKQNAA